MENAFKVITPEILNKYVTGKQPWDLGNETLYELCRRHPGHANDQEIIAKIWLIGRAYAAAIERRKQKPDDFIGDDFYTKKVEPQISDSPIDEWFSVLKDIKDVNEENLTSLLDTHFKLMNLFKDISGLEKRSLASKYLHFHFRDLFFIFDSRAVAAIQKLSGKIERTGHYAVKVDDEYRKFCEKCLQVRRHIEENYGQRLTPRQLDNLLLYIADDSFNLKSNPLP